MHSVIVISIARGTHCDQFDCKITCFYKIITVPVVNLEAIYRPLLVVDRGYFFPLSNHKLHALKPCGLRKQQDRLVLLKGRK